jgi:7-carboxy-7-deazaguanine synthase
MSRATKQAWLSEIFVSWQGEGTQLGQKHLFLRFAGCHLRCVWCDTPDSLVRVETCRVSVPGLADRELANPLSSEQLTALVAEICDADPSITAISLTGGEPLVQAAFLAAWFAEGELPRPCLLETSASLLKGAEAVLEGVAMVSADLKLPSNSGEADLWQEHREFLSLCASKGVETYVKIPVDAQTDVLEVQRGARLVQELLPSASVFLQPLTAVDGKDWTLGLDQLGDLVRVAAEQNVDARMGIQLHKVLGVR